MRDTATSGEGCHGRSGRSQVEVSWQADAATAIVGICRLSGDQWVTAPQCAGGGGWAVVAFGRACSAGRGRW